MKQFSTTAANLVVLLVFLAWMHPSFGYNIPTTVPFGGFFAPITSNGYRDIAQEEHLAAFVMAINELNDKTDGLYDDILPNTQITFSTHGQSGLIHATEEFLRLIKSFSGNGVAAVINSMNDEETLLSGQLATRLHLPMAVTSSTSAELISFVEYPYVAKVAAVESQVGGAMQSLFCLLATKVVIFASTDVQDINLLNSFSDYHYCDVNVLAKFIIRSDVSDFSFEISQAKQTGARYFMLMLGSRQVALMLEQGYAADLFHEYTVISTSVRGSINITQYFSPETDIKQVMTGFFVYQYWPNYYINRTDEAISFAERWRKLRSTAGTVVSGKRVCDQSKDSDGDGWLYQYISDNQTTCTGIDFSGYDPAGFLLQPYTTLTYDATIMMAMAFDYAFKNELDYTDPTVIMNILVENISFSGASGPLDLFEGYNEFDHSDRATRLLGNEYRILNFNPMVYDAGAPEFLVPIGYFGGESRQFESCGEYDFVTCFPPMFLGDDGYIFSPPEDTPPPIYKKIASGNIAIFYFFAAATFFLVLIFFGITIAWRRIKFMKASQPVLLICILIGGLISGFRVILGGMNKTDAVCTAEIWMGHLAFFIMIGSLFVKAYRVHVIVNTQRLRKVVYTATDAFKLLAVIVLLVSVYLGLLTAFANPHMIYQIQEKQNQVTKWKVCELEHPTFQTALFVVEFALLVASFRVCWEIRNVPDIVNESKLISTGTLYDFCILSNLCGVHVAMSALVLICVLIMPIVFLLGLHPYNSELIASIGFGFGSIVTLLLLFVPKIYTIWGILRKNSSSKSLTGASGSGDRAAERKRALEIDTNPGNDSARDDGPTTEDREVDAMLKGKSRTERMMICQDQLRHWQALLLHEQSRVLQGAGSSSQSHSQSHSRNSRHSDQIPVPSPLKRLESDSLSAYSGPRTGDPTMFAIKEDVSIKEKPSIGLQQPAHPQALGQIRLQPLSAPVGALFASAGDSITVDQSVAAGRDKVMAIDLPIHPVERIESMDNLL